MLEPPALPTHFTSTRYWCEENAYNLIANLISQREISASWDIYAVFFSNATRSVANPSLYLASE
jgi:hypothetical protein